MGIADILDETFEIYKSKFVLLIGIAAVLYVPLLLLQSAFQIQPKALMSRGTSERDIALIVGTLAVLGLAYILALALVTGALTFGVSDSYLQRETSIGACYRRMLNASVLFRFLWTNVLVFLAYIGALIVPMAVLFGGVGLITWSGRAGAAAMVFGILLVVAGVVGIIVPIHVLLRLVLVTPSFMIESQSPIGALRRSWELMKGNTGKALAVLFIVGIATTIIQGFISLPFQFADVREALRTGQASAHTPWLTTIVNTITSTLLLPINSIVAIMLYYDMRIRKEGFDLELLAQDLDQRAQRLGEQAGPALPTEQLPPQNPDEGQT
jgi:hypothetical protein